MRLIRTAYRSLHSIARKKMFHCIHVKPDEESALEAKSILSNPSLNQFTKCVTFSTNENTRTDAVDASGPGVYEAQTKLPQNWFHVMQRLGQFPQLSRVELKFFSICAACGDDPLSEMRAEETPELPEFRIEVLRNLFQGLNSTEHGIASKLRELSIKNLQDLPVEEVCTSQNFKNVMARLESLELCITSEHDFTSPGMSRHFRALHEFYGSQLTKYWLRPVASHLKKLKLYSTEVNWGYLPRTDLCELRFPHLRELHLGSFTFTHDWQLDWILSHGATLETLTLSYCPIIHKAFLYEYEVDSHRNITGPAQQSSLTECTWEYNTRWHTYFDRLRKGLPKLKHFGFQFPDWMEGETFEEAEQMDANLSHKRYQVLDEGTQPTCWIEPDDYANEGIRRYDCCSVSYDEDQTEEQLTAPQCDEQDAKALDELLRAVRARA